MRSIDDAIFRLQDIFVISLYIVSNVDNISLYIVSDIDANAFKMVDRCLFYGYGARMECPPCYQYGWKDIPHLYRWYG